MQTHNNKQVVADVNWVEGQAHNLRQSLTFDFSSCTFTFSLPVKTWPKLPDFTPHTTLREPNSAPQLRDLKNPPLYSVDIYFQHILS